MPGLEIVRRQGKRVAMNFRVSREQRAAVDRHLQPLVGIQRDRVGARNRLEPVAIRRVERGPGAERAVDVQPDAELGCDVGDVVQRINGTGIGGAAAGHDRERDLARLAVVLDRRAQRVRAHAKRVVGRNRTQVIGSDAELLGALLDGGMAFGARIEDERRAPALQSLDPQVPARPLGGAVTRCGQRVERRGRAATQQQAKASFAREPDELHDPSADAHHQEHAGVVVAVEPAIHRARDGVGQDRDRRGWRIDPGEGPPVPDGDGPGHDIGLEKIQYRFRREPTFGQRQ